MKHLDREYKCTSCGYDKHVEIHHIKSISSFIVDSTATLYDVNNPDNLVYLCPNCHWEIDNL